MSRRKRRSAEEREAAGRASSEAAERAGASEAAADGEAHAAVELEAELAVELDGEAELGASADWSGDEDEPTGEEGSDGDDGELSAQPAAEADDLAAGDPEAAYAGNGAAVPAGDDVEDEAVAEDAPPLAAVIEGVLFAAAEPVPLQRLVKLLNPWSRTAVSEALEALAAALEEQRRGIRLVETANGFQLRSAAECATWVRQFFSEKPPRLSGPLLETLAVVAYRQPVTRGQIEAVRGVNCDAVIEALAARSLIKVTGRRETPGRPLEYGTTQEFLDLFTLRSLDELPPLPDTEAFAELATIDEEGLATDAEANDRGETAEDLEPGGPGIAEGGGGPDSSGPDPGEREGDPRARDEGGSDPGPDHA